MTGKNFANNLNFGDSQTNEANKKEQIKCCVNDEQAEFTQYGKLK